MAYAERIYNLASGYNASLKRISDNLKDTKSDLMSQLAVIKQQIALNEIPHSAFPTMGGSQPPITARQQIEQEVDQVMKGRSGTTSF